MSKLIAYNPVPFVFSLILLLALSACGRTAAEAGISFTGEISGEITVSAYDTITYRAFLEDAARLFEEKHPGTTVNVSTFSAMPVVRTAGDMILVDYQDDPQGKEDYIRRINTALMSGAGADILAIDVLPFYKYADSGQLENLAAYMEADPGFNKADYRANILDAVEYKNGIWFVPTDYSFNYYTYDSTLIASDAAGFGMDSAFTAGQLLELGISASGGPAMLFNMPDFSNGPNGGIWDRLLAENYAAFLDIPSKTAGFNDGRFAALLESVKQYSEQGYIPKGAAGQTEAGAIMRQARDASARYCFNITNNLSLLNYFVRDLGISMGEGASRTGADDEIAGIQANVDGSVPFTFNQAYGINSNSRNRETAWAFLKFLLNNEAGSSGGMGPRGLPLHNGSRSRYIEPVLSRVFSQRGLGSIPAEAVEQFNEATERLSGQINNWEIRDAVVDGMIAAEVQYFFTGAKTAAEAAEVLQNKADLYLNE